MWREIGPNPQNLVLSLLAVLISLAAGLIIPLLSSSSKPGREQLAWSVNSLTPATATRTPLAVLAADLDANAPDDAEFAWHEPATATPNSVPHAVLTAGLPSYSLAGAPATTSAGDRSFTATAMPATTTPATQTFTATATQTATATATARPTETPTPTASPTVSPAATVAPLPTGTATALRFAPDDRSLALPTRRPLVEAPVVGPTLLPPRAPAVSAAATGTTATARPTQTPAASATPAITPSPAVNAARPPAVTPPALLSPTLEARLRGVVRFEWFPTSLLPVGAYYEMVVWSPEQGPNQAWGVAPPKQTHSLTLNLDELFRSGRFREGSLYWTVLVVEQNPYRRLTQPADSERRYLVLATGG